MADVQRIDVTEDGIIVCLKASKEEYEALGKTTHEILVLPTSSRDLTEVLTTGKLGNSNRIMLPNKILKRYSVTKLIKKVPAKIFDVEGRKFLLIKLKEHKKGVPVFGGEEEG